MVLRIITRIVSVLLTLGFFIMCQSSYAQSDVVRYMVPNSELRNMAQSIDENEIAELVFSGDHIGMYLKHFGNQITVTDKPLIHTFLMALRHAYISTGGIPSNLGDQLRIIYKPTAHGIQKPTLLYFYASSEIYSFGPEFYSALHLLEIYRAKQVRALVRNLDASTIEYISIEGEKEFDITIPETMERIINAVGEVTDQAFIFRDNTVVHFTLRITFKDKTVERIRFSFVDPTNIKPTKLPLPSVLWQYYQKSKATPH